MSRLAGGFDLARVIVDILGLQEFDKTGIYIQRSRGSPLEISFAAHKPTRVPNDAFLLMLQHVNQLKALTLYGTSDNIHNLVKRFDSPAPLLEKLDIRAVHLDPAVVESTVFGGNLSSLRKLRLWGGFISLPWRNMSNLTTLEIRGGTSYDVSMTQLLDFFERTPLLRQIRLIDSLLDSSNAPAERVVSLPP